MINDQLTEGFIVAAEIEGVSRICMISSVGKSSVVLRDVRSGERNELSVNDAQELLASGRMAYLRHKNSHGNTTYEELNVSEKREITRKLKYVRKLVDDGIRKVTEQSAQEKIVAISNEIGENPPHWQSVRAWVNAYLGGGETLKGLFPKHRDKGNRESRLSKLVDGIIEKEKKRFFHQRRCTMASVVRNVEAKIIEHNINHPGAEIKVPAYNTIKSKILSENYSNDRQSRYGKRTLKTEMLSVDSGIESTYALERVEIDHTQLDIKLLHDDTHALLGRPHITVLIDHFSKMLLGLQVSFEVPSFASVSSAFFNAILKKDKILDELGIETYWPAHGIPKTIVADNGAEFWSGNFETACDELGSIAQYCPIRSGHYKSAVERFFGSVNSYVLDDLPGVVRKPGKSGENYDSSSDAKLTFSEFKSYLYRWIVEVYHRLPLADDGKTPLELWQESEDIFPIATEEEFAIAPVLLASAVRRHGRGGVRINNQVYDSPLLRDLYRRDGPSQIKLKYCAYDIGWIYVLDVKNNLFIRVNSTDPSYASGVSVYEDSQIRKKVAETKRSKLESEDLQKAKALLAQERQKAHEKNIRRKSQVSMARSARVEKIGVANQEPLIGGCNEPSGFTPNTENFDMEGWDVE